MNLQLIVLMLALCCFGLATRNVAQEKPNNAPQSAQPAASATSEAHFHHLHLNTLDPKAAIDFYTAKFDSEKAKFAGLLDGVWAQKSWMLFTKVSTPPKWELDSAIWHFGWGAENMKAEYERQQKMGTKFFTPLTDISDIGGNAGAKDLFYYAYVEGPDKALIELNTARHHNFGHLHLFSADPVAAGEWYIKHFGARGRIPTSREPRMYKGYQIGPSVSLMMDNINIIIFPAEYLKKDYPDRWKGKVELESTKGHVVDHVGFSFENLPEALEKLRKDGVKVTDEIRAIGKIKYAFIEGPDKIRIEVIEGHARKE
ncbi:MAG: VOC family protein [Acidobacteriota bacterium]|nr:VOC family protein [Acidobacteriota bacterium]